MQTFSAIALACLLFGSILLMWVPAAWAGRLLQCGTFALGAIWAIRMAIRPDRVEFGGALIPLAGTALWGLLQLATYQTVYRWETWNGVLFWATMFVACFVARQVLAESRLRERFLRAMLAFGAVLAVVSTLQLFTAAGKVFWLFPTAYGKFVLGPFVYKNQYAAFIEMVLPLALVGALADRRRMPVYVTAAAAMYASVIAAASRAGFALASAEIAVVVAVAARRRTIPPRRLAALLATMAAFAGLFVISAGWDNLWSKFAQGNQDAVRSQFLRSTVEMIRDRPWMGFGLGTWSTVYPAYAHFDDGRFANEAHNDWAQWTAEGGIPFLILMLAIALWSLRPAARNLWGLGVVSVFCHCLVDYPIQLQRPALAMWFFVLLGALSAS